MPCGAPMCLGAPACTCTGKGRKQARVSKNEEQGARWRIRGKGCSELDAPCLDGRAATSCAELGQNTVKTP